MLKIPFNESLLLWAAPDTESEPFMYELLINHLKKGLEAVLCVTNKQSRTLLNESKEYGYKLEKYDKQLTIINLNSNLLRKKGLNCLKKEVKKHVKGKELLLCFNNISPIINTYGLKAIKDLEKINQAVKKKEGKSLLLFTEWPYDAELITQLRDSFNNRVYLNTIDEGGFLRKYYSLKSGREFKHFMFDLKKPGGVINIAPKVIVAEPSNNLIESLSQQTVSFDELFNDLRISRGEISHKGLSINLLGVDNDRFSTVMELMGDDSTSVLVMIDPSRPERIEKARQVINSAKRCGLNVIIGLKDKQDLTKVKQLINKADANFISFSNNSSQEEVIRKLLNY